VTDQRRRVIIRLGERCAGLTVGAFGMRRFARLKQSST
jgi:hypothetical protein